MKVYIIEMQVQYEPGKIIGVWINKEAAEVEANKLNTEKTYYGNVFFSIEEFEVNERAITTT